MASSAAAAKASVGVVARPKSHSPMAAKTEVTAMRSAFGGRKLFAEEERRVGERGYEHQQHLRLPAKAQVREGIAQHPADNDATGEPCVQGNQARGFVSLVEGGDQGIDAGLDEAVGGANEKRGGEECREVLGKSGQKHACDMPDCSELEEAADSKSVAQGAAKEDRESEAPECSAADPADLCFVQREDVLEVAHDVSADGEGHGGGDECDAARSE